MSKKYGWVPDLPDVRDHLYKVQPEVVSNLPSVVDLRTSCPGARAAGLEVNLIQDSGLTEFGGIKTYTCLAIGPDYAEKIDVITKELGLY